MYENKASEGEAEPQGSCKVVFAKNSDLHLKLYIYWELAVLGITWIIEDIATGKKEWVGYKLSNMTIESEIKLFWCRNKLNPNP